MMEYQVLTAVDLTAKQIEQHIDFVTQDTRSEILRHVIATSEAQLREALIQLGWTPPKQEKS